MRTSYYRPISSTLLSTIGWHASAVVKERGVNYKQMFECMLLQLRCCNMYVYAYVRLSMAMQQVSLFLCNHIVFTSKGCPVSLPNRPATKRSWHIINPFPRNFLGLQSVEGTRPLTHLLRCEAKWSLPSSCYSLGALRPLTHQARPKTKKHTKKQAKTKENHKNILALQDYQTLLGTI